MVTAVGTPSWAYWTATGSAPATASTGTLSAPTGVTVPAAAAPDVSVSWTAGMGGVTPVGYFVTRLTGTTVSPACATSPTTLVNSTACNDTAVPDGTFTYRVTAVYRSWTKAGSPSNPVTVRNAAAVAFVVEPTDTLVNAIVTPAVTVALRTADGQPFPSPGVPITLTINPNAGGGVLTGTTTVNTDSAGVATFSSLSVNRSGIGYTLTANSPGLTADVSAPFAVLTPPLLGAAANFSILAVTAVVNTGSSTKVSGDVGVSPASWVTGFPVGAIGGDVHAGDATAATAQSALLAAYNDLSNRTPDREIVGELSGVTFLPGVYHSTAALALTTTVTLDGGGDPNAVFVFQTAGAFDTAAVSSVNLINGAKAANVYWVVVGAAGTGAGTSLSGNILALGAITLGDGTTLIGRALSRGTVTLAGSTIRFTDALPPTITIDGGSTATTKDTTPTISGTSNAAASSAVTVRVNGQTLPTTVSTGGTWSVTAAALTAGTHQVVATVRDAAGNGTAVSQLLTVEVNPAPVDLGSAASYAVLATSGITNTGSTVVNGDLGITGLFVLGFPPGVVNGSTDIFDAASRRAQADLDAALDEVSARTPHTEIAGDLGGQTFHIGIHHSTAALALTGNVTLDAEGNPDAIFIFQGDAAFNTAASSTVTLANGAQAANVYWVITGAVGTGASTLMSGTILSRGAITLGATTHLDGRALSRGAVTLAGNVVARPGFGAAARRAPASTAPSTPASTSGSAPATPTASSPPATTSLGTPTTTADSITTTSSPPTTAASSPSPATDSTTSPTTDGGPSSTTSDSPSPTDQAPPSTTDQPAPEAPSPETSAPGSGISSATSPGPPATTTSTSQDLTTDASAPVGGTAP